MESLLKKEYKLEGLGCAMCANKMETDIRKLRSVSAAWIDFSGQMLFLEIDNPAKLDDIVAQTHEIVHRYEPDIVIQEMHGQGQPESESVSSGRTGRKKWAHDASLLAGAILFAIVMVFRFDERTSFTLFLISYLLAGAEIVARAAKNIAMGQVFDEKFLMSVATIGAFAIGEYPEGVAVMLFYQIGTTLEQLAVGRSRRSISALMDIRPDYANLKVENGVRRVAPDTVKAGDLIEVRPGERIPLDGIVTAGISVLDTSALTGESLPCDVEPGSTVLSGSINKNGLLTVEVTKMFGESTVARILDLVQKAGSHKATVENFMTRFARVYTPAVVFAALALALLPPLLIPGAEFADWINRALIMLVVSCPCALVISIPLSFFAGIGGASRHGILIKGGNYLEALSQVDTVVFDKTGTLTAGVFSVAALNPSDDFTADMLLKTAAYAESRSSHPIAVSILKAYGKGIADAEITDYEEVAGYGVRATVAGRRILAGREKLLNKEGIVCNPHGQSAGTALYIAVDGVFAGSIVMRDAPKADSGSAIKQLKKHGVRRVLMLTGDTKESGEAIGRELGLDQVYTGLLPHEKVERVERLAAETVGKGKLIFVGDGINDAPALARSDVGIAMGGVGSDAAIEAADIVLMTDEPLKIVTAVQIARKTMAIVWQNVIFALGVKAVILILGAFGMIGMWVAVFGDVGVALIATLNAMRALGISPKALG